MDGTVYEAPAIESASFDGGVIISGDFTSSQARSLAIVLDYGSLPYHFVLADLETITPRQN